MPDPESKLAEGVVWARVLDWGGSDYALSDFREILDNLSLTINTARPQAAGAPAMLKPAQIGSLKLDPNASPDFDKFQQLLDIDPKIRATWQMKRKDLPSPSEYDESLTFYAVQAGWEDQGIVNLLIAFRRMNKIEPKLRQDYYARTINKARATVKMAAPVEVATEAPVVPDDVLGDISRMWGVPVTGVFVHPGEEATYELEIDGREVFLGDSKAVLKMDVVQARIMSVTNGQVVVPLLKRGQWENLIRRLMQAAVLVPLDQANQWPGEAESWVRAYFAQGPAPILNGQWTEAAKVGLPFFKDGWLYVSGAKMRSSLYKFGSMERIKPKYFALVMTRAGCVAETLKLGGGKRSPVNTTREVWRLARDLTDAAGLEADEDVDVNVGKGE